MSDSPDSTIAVRTESLAKRFGRVQALDAVSLQVPSGEIFGFLGPNGAGKSTFVRILLGLMRPDGGRAELFGRPAGRPDSRAGIGYLPEQMRAYPFVRVDEFLSYHARLAGIDGAVVRRCVAQALAQVNSESLARRRIAGLSKGMLQRVGIAQALLGGPRMLILDEPSSGLDPIGMKELRDLLTDLRNRGTTIMLNSHLLSEVERTCDSIAILHRGRIVASGRSADLGSADRYLAVRVQECTARIEAALQALCTRPIQHCGGELRLHLRDECDSLRVHESILSNGGRLLWLGWQGESLEDIFYRLIKDETERDH